MGDVIIDNGIYSLVRMDKLNWGIKQKNQPTRYYSRLIEALEEYVILTAEERFLAAVKELKQVTTATVISLMQELVKDNTGIES